LIEPFIDNLITLGTPQNIDLPVINRNKVGNYCNISSESDIVQILGASYRQLYSIVDASYNFGRATRDALWAEQEGDFLAWSYYTSLASYYLNRYWAWIDTTRYDPMATNGYFSSASHSDLHSKPYWEAAAGFCGLR